MKDLLSEYSTKDIFISITISIFLATTIFYFAMNYYAQNKVHSKPSQVNYEVVSKDEVDKDLYVLVIKEKSSGKVLKIIRDERTDQTEVLK